MNFSVKVIFMCMVFKNLEYLAYQQTTPEERCEPGKNVCFDCFKYGTCVANGNTYEISDIKDCEPNSYCDDSLYGPDGPYGNCAPLPPSITNCSCSLTTQNCIPDPNRPTTILHCDGSEPIVDPPCQSGVPDFDQCKCLQCSETCPLLDDPTDDCAKYYFCNGGDLISTSCKTPLCFDQDLCMCAQKSTSVITSEPTSSTTSEATTSTTSEATTSTTSETTLSEKTTTSTNNQPSTTTTEIIDCPPGCPYVDDPTDDCAKFYICEDGERIAAHCSGILCFDQNACICN